MVLASIRSTIGVAITAGGPTQDITIPGIGTPKGALVIMTRRSGGFGSSPQRKVSWGVTDGIFEGGVSVLDQTLVSASNTQTVQFDDALIRLLNNAGTGYLAIGNSTLITDGIRINWSLLPNNGYQIFCHFWVGDNIQLQAGNVTPTATVGQDVPVSTVFRPQHIVAAGAHHLGPNEVITRGLRVSYAHVVDREVTPEGGSGAKVRSVTWASTNRVGTSEQLIVLNDEDVICAPATAIVPVTFNPGTGMSAVPFTNGGFSVRTTAGSGTNPGPTMFYLAVSYGDNRRVSLDDYLFPTVTGSNDEDVGIKGDSIQSLQTGIGTGATPGGWAARAAVDNNLAGIGGITFANEVDQEWSINEEGADAVGTMDTAIRTRANIYDIVTAGGLPSILVRGTFIRFNTDGTFTTLYTTASPTRYVAFVLETNDHLGNASTSIFGITCQAQAQQCVQAASDATAPFVSCQAVAQQCFQATANTGIFGVTCQAQAQQCHEATADTGIFGVTCQAQAQQCVQATANTSIFGISCQAAAQQCFLVAVNTSIFGITVDALVLQEDLPTPACIVDFDAGYQETVDFGAGHRVEVDLGAGYNVQQDMDGSVCN